LVGNSVYFESGTYIDTLDAVSFCDSVIFTELTIIEMAVSMIDTTICAGDTLMIGNSFYTESGNYTDVVIAGNGCDSMVQTELSIAPSYYMEIDTAVCADVLFEYAGQVYPLPAPISFRLIPQKVATARRCTSGYHRIWNDRCGCNA
jgi:hypothetical protein